MSTKKNAAKKPAAGTKKPAAPRAPRAAAKKVIESRHISELLPKDRQHLEELLRTSPDALTEGELAHLQARAAYLTTDERAKYGIK